ncbi:MAG: GNAT family N-acetyltransferase [Ruminiclostridium sp.]|nr:GNAT family N-acetyltransferase [Ruminiclostridium sp.]
MFEFTDRFDVIEGGELVLRIIEKNSGDDKMIPFYYYDIFRKSDMQAVGKISVRIGNNFHSYYNGHIGYEIFEEYRGQGLACKACREVLSLARFHGMEFVYLTCGESNRASRRTIERLGAEFVECADVPKEYFAWYEGMERQLIYKLKL